MSESFADFALICPQCWSVFKADVPPACRYCGANLAPITDEMRTRAAATFPMNVKAPPASTS